MPTCKCQLGTCGASFNALRSDARYCSNACRQMAYRIAHGQWDVRRQGPPGMGKLDTARWKQSRPGPWVARLDEWKRTRNAAQLVNQDEDPGQTHLDL